MKMDNRGQSLVLFILLLPIMVGIMALVIDVGNALVLKNHTDNVVEMVMDISLTEHLETNEINRLLNLNLKNNDNGVRFSGEDMVIESHAYSKGIFSKLFGFSGFPIQSVYVGRYQNHKIIINKKK